MPDDTHDLSARPQGDAAPDPHAAMQAGELAMADAEQPELGREPIGAEPAQTPLAGGESSSAKSSVNSQLLDTLAALAPGAHADAPVLARASLDQVMAQAQGLILLNAAQAQQNAYVTANATVLAAVNRIMALRPQQGPETPGQPAASASPHPIEPGAAIHG
jgi:Killing trait